MSWVRCGVFAAWLFVATAGSGATLVVEIPNGAGKVKSVIAADRVENKKLTGKPEGKRFVFRDLPQGIYDVVIETEMGTIEGVNLKTYDELGDLETPEEFGKITSKDFREILRRAPSIKIFENKRRVFAIAGHHKRARVLFERYMDEKMTLPSAEPKVVWRIEVWNYKYWYGGWLREKTYEMIQRKNVTVSEFAKVRWMYEPSLGGVKVGGEADYKLVAYSLPPRLDPTRGVIDGRRAEPKLVAPEDEQEKDVEEVEEIE